MKSLSPALFAALLSAAALTATAAGAQSAGSFELRFEARDGARMAAVVNLRNGGSAVAVGRETLDLLSDKDAQKTIQRLHAQSEIEIDGAIEGAPAEATGETREILIHRMDYDEADNVAPKGAEERVYRPHRKSAGDSLGDMSLEQDAVRRIVYVKGAGEAEAAKFIDDLDGLEDDEKSAMKEAVGL